MNFKKIYETSRFLKEIKNINNKYKSFNLRIFNLISKKRKSDNLLNSLLSSNKHN